MALCDFLCPSRHASLPSLGDTMSVRLSFRSHRSKTPNRGPGVGHPVPASRNGTHGGEQDLPGSWRTLLSLCPVLRPRQDRRHQALAVCRHGLRSDNGEGSHDKMLSRLNRTALGLAVYASPRGSPHADAKLASGCWPSSTGRNWLPVGFQRKVSELLLTSHPPLPSFPGAMSVQY